MRLQKHQLEAYQAAQRAGEDMSKWVPPPPKPRRSNEESAIQRQLIKWWAANCRHFGVPELCLFSIPNGGNGDARRGSIMKAEGQRKGAPDLFLAVLAFDRTPAGTCGHKAGAPGLFLELKRREGVVSPEQEVFHSLLRKQGYQVSVCRTLTSCIDTITAYLT